MCIHILAPCLTPAQSFRTSRGIKRDGERDNERRTNTHVCEVRGREAGEETNGTREGKIEMENERVGCKREEEGRREKKRPEIKIQSFRPVLHHADEDNGIPRYFLSMHGIFLRVNTRAFSFSLSI